MRALASVVVGDALFQIGSVSAIKLAWQTLALKDARVKHAGTRNGLPSVARNAGMKPSFAQKQLQRAPSFARNAMAFRAKDGGADRNRTCDLLIANETLYQLSYDPNPPIVRLG